MRFTFVGVRKLSGSRGVAFITVRPVAVLRSRVMCGLHFSVGVRKLSGSRGVDLSDQWQLELPPGLTTEAEFDPPQYYPFYYVVQQLSVTRHSAEWGNLTVCTSD